MTILFSIHGYHDDSEPDHELCDASRLVILDDELISISSICVIPLWKRFFWPNQYGFEKLSWSFGTRATPATITNSTIIGSIPLRKSSTDKKSAMTLIISLAGIPPLIKKISYNNLFWNIILNIRINIV